jgi:signal transduction histidine kinase
MMSWRRLVGDRPIVTRLVLAVAVTMAVVLLLAGAFVFWRVQFALNRQLNQDLAAYQEVIERGVSTGSRPPTDTPGQSYQVYDATTGEVTDGNATVRLVDPLAVEAVATTGEEIRGDIGRLIPPAPHPYRYVATRVATPEGDVVVASAISRHKHDEALRELLLQLAIADLATLAAASIVGYLVARAALNPVERYRLAAESSDGERLLPVPEGRDDEISRLGTTFNSLLQRIRRSNERERQFLADASHELRSPLAVMRTELEMAQRPQRTTAQTDVALQSLSGQVERLIALSNALLALEELHAHDKAFQDPVDAAELAHQVVERFADAAASSGRTIETRVDAGLALRGNSHWLDLALGNLVSNALRYGSGTITITAKREGDRAVLGVEDEGAGPPEDFVDDAFDRFTRADPSRSTGGTGLGLALVQAVAEAHDGTATLKGSRIELSLPLTPPTGPDGKFLA